MATAGDDADYKTITISVTGMTCGACVNHVTNALEDLESVRRVKVTLADESAEVKYDANRLAIAELTSAVREAGYTAEHTPVVAAYVSGTAIDGNTGDLIADANVKSTIRHYDREKKEYVNDFEAEATTDASGRFSFSEIPEDSIGKVCNYVVVVEADGYVTPDYMRRATQSNTLRTDSARVFNYGMYREDAVRTFRGTTISAVTGDPISDVTVTAVIEYPETEETIKTFESKSGSDGSFVVEVPVAATNGV